jgi:L-lactate dehydrogenase complex protein LldG
MSDVRSAILGRLRQGQRTGRIPRVSVETLTPQAAPPAEACLERFLQELTALGVEHHVERSAEDVRARVVAIVGNREVLAWHRDRLPYDAGDALANVVDGEGARERQAQAEIGVTGCDAAIAETGSLVLLTSEAKPRTASLLPPVHLAIVRRDDLRFSLDQFFRERAGDVANASCCAVITGPSRTADIELTLTLGVHGPGKVIVIVGP